MDRECNAEAVDKCADKNKGQKRQLRRKCVQTDAYIKKNYTHPPLIGNTKNSTYTHMYMFLFVHTYANINKYVCYFLCTLECLCASYIFSRMY